MLDFGMVKRIPDTVRIGFTKEIFGAFFGLPKMYADGLIMRGVVAERERERLEELAVEGLADPKVRAMLFDHTIDEQGEAKAAMGSIAEMFLGLETLKTPQDAVMFLRALGITIAVCKEIAPEVPMSEIMAPIRMPMLMGLVADNPEYGESVMKAMATMQADE